MLTSVLIQLKFCHHRRKQTQNINQSVIIYNVFIAMMYICLYMTFYRCVIYKKNQ